MSRSELIRERKRLRLLLDSIPPAGSFGAMFRAREAKAAPLRKRIAELDELIGPVKFFTPRPMTWADRKIAKQYKGQHTTAFGFAA